MVGMVRAGAVYLLYMKADVNQPVAYSVKITSGRAGFNATLAQNSYFGSSICMLSDRELTPSVRTLRTCCHLLCVLEGGVGTHSTRIHAICASAVYGAAVDGNGVADVAVGAYGEDKLAGVVYILFMQNAGAVPVMVGQDDI
jgi:hypothetical protein